MRCCVCLKKYFLFRKISFDDLLTGAASSQGFFAPNAECSAESLAGPVLPEPTATGGPGIRSSDRSPPQAGHTFEGVEQIWRDGLQPF